MGFSPVSFEGEMFIRSWWNTLFFARIPTLNPGNDNQFEVDEAKSKLFGILEVEKCSQADQ